MGVGVLVACLLAVWIWVAYGFPASMALGKMDRFGFQTWHAVPVSVLMNGLACVAAVWAFRPQFQAECVGHSSGKDAAGKGAAEA
mmetsp:Transcript_57146/g.173976  ORF Transcript_57146/g.173976 Transcript_57146/m.173976 type:complete len:85 (+) Transcript_57146:106-360(+)